MNLTVALLAGLFLLLPGLTALAAWNGITPRHGAQRPELPLTSVTALFLVLGVSLAAHILGILVVELVRLATHEAARLAPGNWPAGDPLPVPLDAAIAMQKKDGVAGDRLLMVTLQVVTESIVVFWIVSGRGFDLLLDRIDLQAQGWVYTNIVRPHRHGQTPVAYVLTTLTNGALGAGYFGVVEQARQNADGELKVLSLRQPQAFVYELSPVTDRRPQLLKIHDGKLLPGVVVMEAARIQNVVVHWLAASPEDETRLLEAVDKAYKEKAKAETASTSTTAAAKAAKAPARPRR